MSYSTCELFVCGQVSVMSPADIVKVRLQCQTEGHQNIRSDSKVKYRGPLHCLLSIARDDGLRGLYRGSAALALRDGPSFATYFLTYNTICDLLSAHDKRTGKPLTYWCFSQKHVRTLNLLTKVSQSTAILKFWISQVELNPQVDSVDLNQMCSIMTDYHCMNSQRWNKVNMCVCVRNTWEWIGLNQQVWCLSVMWFQNGPWFCLLVECQVCAGGPWGPRWMWLKPVCRWTVWTDSDTEVSFTV